MGLLNHSVKNDVLRDAFTVAVLLRVVSFAISALRLLFHGWWADDHGLATLSIVFGVLVVGVSLLKPAVRRSSRQLMLLGAILGMIIGFLGLVSGWYANDA